MATGIRQRHSRECRTHKDRKARCNCKPSYEAWIYLAREKTKVRRTFSGKGALEAAKAWRTDGLGAVRKGTMRAPKPITLAEAFDIWLAGARDGSIRNRAKDPYKPSAIRSYERAWRLRVEPELGAQRMARIQKVDLQDLVDRLLGEGLNPSTIEMTIVPLRALWRYGMSRWGLGVNPTTGLELPALGPGRERIADPEEAAKLLAALPAGDRALWATAMYAGLRRGELKALRGGKINLAAGIIHVEHGWDDVEGEIQTKGKNRRRVPIAAVLRDYLDAHLTADADPAVLVFGETASDPFSPSKVTKRADKLWKQAELDRITLHECRHTYASLMIAAGVNAKALSTYMGHASVTITYDRYGHLMPGNEGEAAGLLDAYLERANTQARLAAVTPATGAISGAQPAPTAIDSA